MDLFPLRRYRGCPSGTTDVESGSSKHSIINVSEGEAIVGKRIKRKKSLQESQQEAEAKGQAFKIKKREKIKIPVDQYHSIVDLGESQTLKKIKQEVSCDENRVGNLKEDGPRKKRSHKTKKRENVPSTSIGGATGNGDVKAKREKTEYELEDTSFRETVKGNGDIHEESMSYPHTSKKKKKKERKLFDAPMPISPLPSGGKSEGNLKRKGARILNSIKQSKLPLKVKRNLPQWLATPEIVNCDSEESSCQVDEIGLKEVIVENLAKMGITQFFPVQTFMIPWLIKNMKSHPDYARDVCVSAPTGSGKTLIYVTPVVQCLCDRFVPKIRALVIVPVRDLGVQVHKVFKTVANGTRLSIGLTLGHKVPLKKEQEMLVKRLPNGTYESLVDVQISTPGRLVEHLQCTPGYSLHHLQYLIIDEADQVMERMHHDWLYRLDDHMRKSEVSVRPQKLLLSATLSHDPEMLASLKLHQPKLFQAATVNTELVKKTFIPTTIREKCLITNAAYKPLVVYDLLSRNWKRVLIFVKSNEDVHRLVTFLLIMDSNLKIAELTVMQQSQHREKLLGKFCSGAINVLVASDRMARGMDFPLVDCVVCYDPPKYLRTYIHRAGRTGRAGTKGRVVTILTHAQVDAFKFQLAKGNHENIKFKEVNSGLLADSLELYKEALPKLKEFLQKEEEEKVRHLKLSKRIGYCTRRKKSKRGSSRKKRLLNVTV